MPQKKHHPLPHPHLLPVRLAQSFIFHFSLLRCDLFDVEAGTRSHLTRYDGRESGSGFVGVEVQQRQTNWLDSGSKGGSAFGNTTTTDGIDAKAGHNICRLFLIAPSCQTFTVPSHRCERRDLGKILSGVPTAAFTL